MRARLTGPSEEDREHYFTADEIRAALPAPWQTVRTKLLRQLSAPAAASRPMASGGPIGDDR